MEIILEACVTTLTEAARAERLGADRLELCRDLHTGGLTPPANLVRLVRRSVAIPIQVLIRSRPGDYCYSKAELDQMRSEAMQALDAGADGIVFGALTVQNEVDLKAVAQVVPAGASVTFHRAFDEVADPEAAVDDLVSRGVQRILTSGGQPTALEGIDRLKRAVAQADGRLVIMAGGGVRGPHVRQLIQKSGAGEVHARASAIPDLCRALGRAPKTT